MRMHQGFIHLQKCVHNVRDFFRKINSVKKLANDKCAEHNFRLLRLTVTMNFKQAIFVLHIPLLIRYALYNIKCFDKTVSYYTFIFTLSHWNFLRHVLSYGSFVWSIKKGGIGYANLINLWGLQITLDSVISFW